MSAINRVVLLGNIGKDPEVRSTTGGSKIATLSVATTERWKDKQSGENKEKTEWHKVVMFGTLAEVAEKYLNKGSRVYVEGKLQTRKWTDKDGSERYTTEVVVETPRGQLVMLDRKDGSSDRSGEGDPTPRSKPATAAKQASPTDAPFDDEIPF